ncbi:hypothetical protein NVV95_16135 [Herbiconiux sp. CPCC 205716]|uniref:MmyB-like transcription regulator ligand binding domain-containing protein n=1 Tax=Herbiconiux gentiana TaxID=2970912 RepID=A0ABT2GIL9_9MICO|nr:hypothetical protein [Herbiconiux gentiana]MCS5716075.1 hypothetical protein [Herbiconiux gentiana]
MPAHIPPGVQRLIARLGEVPLAVFTASWDLLTWSRLWTALLGDPARSTSHRANLLIWHFTGVGFMTSERRIASRSNSVEAFEASLVGDLRRVLGRYPDDRGVRSLVADLLAASPRFAGVWHSGAVGEHQSERKVVENDLVGDIELDCDVFTVAGTDLRIVVYTAAAGTPAAASTSSASRPLPRPESSRPDRFSLFQSKGVGMAVFPRGARVFVDECKARGYWIAATAVAPGDAAAVEKALRRLTRPGQSRIHFRKESDSSRRQLVAAVCAMEVEVVLYLVSGCSDRVARPLLLTSLVGDLVASEASQLVLERDESAEAADRTHIASALRSTPGAGLQYRHVSPGECPLLWVSDLVAWCAHRGGDWRRRVSPLITDVVEVGA